MTGFYVSLGNVPLLGQRITAGSRAGLQAAGLVVKGQAQIYPKVRRLKVDTSKWTAKQRRFFFAALRDGRIEVPYRRGLSPTSERLKQRWTSKVDASGKSVTVGNNSSYARQVYSKADQSWYHKGNWPTEEDIAKKATPAAVKAYTAGIKAELEK